VTDDGKQTLLREIDRRQDEIVSFLSRFLQASGENPPGDTSQPAEFLSHFLQSAGIEVRRFEPLPGKVSLVAQIDSGRPGPHFMFNGHLDTFPADDPSMWAHPPFRGEIADGKVFGRGAADMRCGLAASTFVFALMHELESSAAGKVSLVAVADEEVGGWWGTGWLIREHPELLPDACIIGEPDGLQGVRIGEKGKAQLRLKSAGEPYYAAMAVGEDCIAAMAAALPSVKAVTELRGTTPADLEDYMPEAMQYSRVARDHGRGWLLQAPSVNFGVIRGGLKVNMVPRWCEVEVDIRNPLGISPDGVRQFVLERLARDGHAAIQVELMPPVFEASYTSPQSLLPQIVYRNVTDLTGRRPTFSYAFSATDARYLRPDGVPCVIYGPYPNNVAGFDEYVTIEELMTVARVHASSAMDFLTEASGSTEGSGGR
jgi:succinyl-diaminopimelate desuccinylase